MPTKKITKKKKEKVANVYELVDAQFTKSEKVEFLRIVIDGFKKDLIAAIVQEWMYSQEYQKPIHISKAQALENMGTYQQRMRYLVQNIEAIKWYAKEHGLEL